MDDTHYTIPILVLWFLFTTLHTNLL